MNSRTLVKNSDGGWTIDVPKMNIAQKLFNAIQPSTSFELLFATYMTQRTNMLYVNRNFDLKVAFFRYVDGSTVHLDNMSSRWTAPCNDCVDFRKCVCEIHEALEI